MLSQSMHLHWTVSRSNGQVYRYYSLARSYKDGNAVRKEILVKLGTLSNQQVLKIQHFLHGWRAMIKRSPLDMTQDQSSNEGVTLSMFESLLSGCGKRFDYPAAEQVLDMRLFQMAVAEAFAEVEDPRVEDCQGYPFYGTLMLILAATLAGAQSIRAVHHYAKKKLPVLGATLGMEACPTYGVFWWIITRMESKALNAAFMRWVQSWANEVLEKKGRAIAFDGKRLRGAKKKPTTFVSAFDSTRGLLLGQVEAGKKPSEITAIPELLKVIDVRDAMVTIDAIGCQVAIVQDIIERGGGYMIALKGNQQTLFAEADNYFSQARAVDYAGVDCDRWAASNWGHGRKETREVTITRGDLSWLDCREKWPGMVALVEIRSTRFVKGQATVKDTYYITSKALTAEEAAILKRGHWAIENKLHWVMDVIFNDDASLANRGHAAENLGLFRRMAYCLLRQDTVNGRGMAHQQREAMWDDGYVHSLLSRFLVQASS